MICLELNYYFVVHVVVLVVVHVVVHVVVLVVVHVVVHVVVLVVVHFVVHVDVQATKPGRQIVTFLIFCNLGLWITYNFEIQKVNLYP